MYCSYCGGMNEDGTNFCNKCGNKLNDSLEVAAAGSSSVETKAESPAHWVVLSIVCAVISIFLLPPIIGGLGIFFGYKVKSNGNDNLGTTLMILCAICLLFGMAVGAIVASSF